MIARLLLPALLLLAGACDRQPAQAPARPAAAALELSGRVVDKAELLDPKAEAFLTGYLAGLEGATTDQVVVVTVPELGGEAIDRYSRRLGNDWGIGRADVDNGVLLVVAPKERQVRIEVGKGLTGLMTDARAKAIIDRTMLPHFKAGQYREAITDGVSAIGETLRSDTRRPIVRNERAAA